MCMQTTTTFETHNTVLNYIPRYYASQQLLTTSWDLPRPKSRLLSNEAPIYCNLSAVQLLSLVLHAALISLPNFRWLFHHVACEGGVWPFVLGIGTCHPSVAWHRITPAWFPSQSGRTIFAYYVTSFFWSCVWFSNDLKESDASWSRKHASCPFQPLNDLERRKMPMEWTTTHRRSPPVRLLPEHNLYCHGGTRMCLLGEFNAKIWLRTTLLIYRAPSGLE